jgi:hypothetical protein
MMEPFTTLTLSAASLFGLIVLTCAGLKGFSAWIDLKRTELDMMQRVSGGAGPTASSRIEIADVKERLRKLEAIAAGVEL